MRCVNLIVKKLDKLDMLDYGALKKTIYYDRLSM